MKTLLVTSLLTVLVLISPGAASKSERLDGSVLCQNAVNTMIAVANANDGRIPDNEYVELLKDDIVNLCEGYTVFLVDPDDPFNFTQTSTRNTE